MRPSFALLSLRSFAHRAHIAALLLLFVLLGSLTSLGGKPRAGAGQAATVGNRIWLRDAQPIVVNHVGSTKLVQAMASAQPLALAEGDFDADGVEDLAVGYASSNGGILAVHRGNLDAFAPQSHASFLAIGRGEFPSPFLPNAKLIGLPVRPDFVSVGSFNGNSFPDVVVAQRGDSSIYLLANDGKGNLGAPKAASVGGPITALAAGEFGQIGVYSKLLVGISDKNGSYLMVYTGTKKGFGGLSVLPLRAPASNIVFATLGDVGPDAFFISGGQVGILHSGSMKVETLPLPVSAQSIAVGSFIWDRNTQHQIAILGSDGNVHIAAHSEFDPRAYTKEELQSVHRTGRGKYVNPLAHAKTVPVNGWKIVESFSGVASSGQAVLLRTRISDHGADDVMVLDPSGRQMTVIAHSDLAPGAANFLPGEISSRPYNGSPKAALAMRTNVDGRPGVIAIHHGQVAPSLMMPLPDPTFFPNEFDDPTPPADLTTVCNNTSNTDTSSACSLREALLKANATAGTDTIMLAAGTYSLTIGRPSTASPDYTGNHGALYVNDSANIIGAGQNSTIIQWGTPGSGVKDMVMAVNEDINPLTNASASISNLTIQNGQNNGSDFAAGSTAATEDGDGGCMEFDTGTSGQATLSLQNVTLQNCATTNGNAGGIVLFNFLQPDGDGHADINQSIIQNNAPHVNTVGAGGGSAGGIGCTVTGDASGNNIPFTLNLTNSQVLNNLATQVNQGSAAVGGGMLIFGNGSAVTQHTTIHNTVISENQAGGEGGAIDATTAFVIDQGSVISNNSGGKANELNNSDGGAIFISTFPETTTISNVTITGNSTTGDGGGIFVDASGGTVNISFSRFAGNTAGGTNSLETNTTDPGSNLRNRDTGIQQGDEGTIVTAQDNWWGTNSPSTTIGPSTSTCPAGVAQVCFDPWIELTNTASPTTIQINQTSTLTASFLQDNHGTAIDVSNLGVLIGLPITFDNAVLGTLSDAQTTIQSTGTATATYTAGTTGGNGSADATVDQATVTADITVLQPPSITKSFAPTTVATNTPSTVSFAVTNPNTVTIDASFTDSLPAGLVVATTPTVVNNCRGTVTATAGSGSISFSNSALAVGTCGISVNVQSATDGTYNNSVTIDSTAAGNGNTATATLTVINPPSITKTFGAATVPLNGSTSLTFTLNNSNTNTALNGVAFSDSLPAGLAVATPNNLNATCNGTASATAGSSSASLSSTSLAPGASCTVSLNVTGTTGGVKNNSVQVTSTNGGTGNTSNASITVVSPPTVSKAFGAASIALNSSTSLSFSVTNPNATSSLSGIAFTDTLPAGLQVASTPNASNSCGGTFTAAAGSGSVSLSGGTIAASGSCSISVSVTGTAAGTQNNTTGAISSTEGGTGGTASASVTVVAPPSIAKAFNPTTIALNATTSLTFTITDPAANTVAAAGVAFSDTLPTGLTVSSGTSAVCGGTLVTTAPTGIALSGATITVGTPCQFSVTVTGTASGQFTNTTGAVTSTNGGTGNTATASLTVASPPSISKAFGAASIPLNGTTSLTLSISNPNTGLSLSGIAFTDTLPTGLVVASTPNLNNTCGGTATAVGGAGSASLSGATLAASASCTVSLNVQGTTAGVKNNSVQVTSTNGGTGNTSTASITVVAPPTISKAFGASSIALNGTTSLSFTISNPNATSSLSGIAFTDTLPAGLQVASPPNASNSCGGTFTAVAGSGGVGLSGGTIAASGSCSISVSVTGTAAGTQNNTTGAVTSAEGGTGGTASASVVVVAPPSISKVFGAANVAVNGTTSLTLTITNPNAGTALSGVAVTDNLPTGLVVATPSGLSDTCGGTATAVAGSTSVSLSGGSIAASSSCAVGVNVTPTTSGPELNTTGNVTSTNGGTGNVASASLQAGDFKILVFPPSETIPAGHMAVYALTLSSASGFTGHINLTCSGGPPKSKCTIIPPSVTLSSGSKLAAAIIDLSVPKGASLGTFTITFTGTSGSLSHSATASLTVK